MTTRHIGATKELWGDMAEQVVAASTWLATRLRDAALTDDEWPTLRVFYVEAKDDAPAFVGWAIGVPVVS